MHLPTLRPPAAAGLLLHLLTLFTTVSYALAPLPEGNTGIAARYPGDAGIGTDSNVILADDFESYSGPEGLPARWNGGVYHDVRLTTAAGHVFSGKQALEFYLPKQSAEWSNTVSRNIDKKDELEVLFLRYYTQFDSLFDVSGSCHNGGGMSAHYFIDGQQATPGIPADGYNKFLAEFESWRGTDTEPSPGLLNVYIYHPAQRSQWGDHFFPNGEVMPNTSLPGDFGSDFTARPNISCTPGKWYCCEIMVKANTVGSRDGRIACWLDGVLIADFPDMRLRDVDSLKINRFGVSLHAGSNTTRETWKWYDNMVAATSYIGPMVGISTTRPNTIPIVRPADALQNDAPFIIAVYTTGGALVEKRSGSRYTSDVLRKAMVPCAPGTYFVTVTTGCTIKRLRSVVVR